MTKPNCETCGKSVKNQCRAITGKNDLPSAWSLCQGSFWRSAGSPAPFFISYPGLDENESLDEYLYDIGMTESDYVGWDVGAQ